MAPPAKNLTDNLLTITTSLAKYWLLKVMNTDIVNIEVHLKQAGIYPTFKR